MNSTDVSKQRRPFFLLVGAILISIGAWKFYKTSMISHGWLGTGIALITIELFIPPVARALFKAWMAFARVLGKIQTTLLLTIIYFGLMVPIALCVRYSQRKKKSPETLAREKGSAWLPVAPLPDGPDHYYRQF